MCYTAILSFPKRRPNHVSRYAPVKIHHASFVRDKYDGRGLFPAPDCSPVDAFDGFPGQQISFQLCKTVGKTEPVNPKPHRRPKHEYGSPPAGAARYVVPEKRNSAEPEPPKKKQEISARGLQCVDANAGSRS